MHRANALLVFLVFLIALGFRSALAQSTYDRDALRIKTSLIGAKIVSGVEEQEVAKLSMFPSQELSVLLEARSEEASRPYLNYRSKQISGGVLYLVGLAAFFSGAVVYGSEEDDGLAAGLTLGGLAMGLVALWRFASGARRIFTNHYGFIMDHS
ncbi:MAG: hypothetical protein GTO42_08715 [Candidatus Latescibacteria bacterium]|nr:hypothetical protein [Candidatus Latescibacterota bacterium]NIO29042.1 hypothetical protein [Candidatus Latescibacterota bacterium]NIO56667.1 hypothetical protein [Candidatus Latescibacterota bacterium]NIT02250.1 hypothetical protein [Candidatus Latescibacterota bacterium]NIT39135.1 hypothetical protein [Candidatus Latescibacterota bacterium]